MRAIEVSAFGQKQPFDSPCRSPPCGRSMCQLSAGSGRSIPSVGAASSRDPRVSFRPKPVVQFSSSRPSSPVAANRNSASLTFDEFMNHRAR